MGKHVIASDCKAKPKQERSNLLLDCHSQPLGLLRPHFVRPRNDIRTIFLIIIFLMLAMPSYAMLDIFDYPKEAERKQKVTERQAAENLLTYPKECFLKGDYNEVFKACQQLLNYQPAEKVKGEILYLMGLSCLKLERFLEARSYFNDIILRKGEKQDLKTNACLGIADAYLLEERLDKALDAYSEILTKYPDSPVEVIVYYRLGEVLTKMRRPDEAKPYLDKVRNEFPFSFESRLSGNLTSQDNSCAPAANKNDYNYVQVGCYNAKDNADKICEKLVKEGFDASILESENGQKPRFRVGVGRFHSRDQVEAMETRLKKAGYSTKICP